ncbi:hypothetical protein C8A05DRAFT_12186, partial [Staphylotrichum tortipilum]
AIAHARTEHGNDLERIHQIAIEVARFDSGVGRHKNTGESSSFGHNTKVRRMKGACKRAVEEFIETGMNSRFRPPMKIEVLALRYCSPQGEGNASINEMLSELYCLHLADSTGLPHGTSAQEQRCPSTPGF